MSDYIMIETAFNNIDEAHKVRDELLSKKLVASTHIIESESSWNWNREREEAKEPEEDGLDELDKLVTNALNKPMADGFKDIVARRDAGELKIENEELSKALDELNLDDYKLNFTSDEATKDEAEAAEDETQELE